MYMTIHKQYKTLAYLITEKAKQMGKMKQFEYNTIVKPYATILRTQPLSEQQLLSGLNRAGVMISK